MRKMPMIINIRGVPAGTEDSHELQSIYPLGPLIKSLGNYMARSLHQHPQIPVLHFQKIMNRSADKVDELSNLSFEPNQRVGELVALASFVATVNKINEQKAVKKEDFMPAWQKAGQDASIKNFTGKASWDGFVYEHVPIGKEDPEIQVVMSGVEIKSLMINPNSSFTNLNDLLSERMRKFSDSFQIDGSIGIIVIPPYSQLSGTKISFDLKRATDDINKNIGNVTCALVFIRNESDGEKTTISTMTYIVSKDPKIVGGNIDHVEMVRVPFCKYKKSDNSST